MNRRLAFCAVLVFLSASLFAVQPQTIKGHLVDIACASETAEKPRANFREKHSKHCLQMPDCAESGYGVLTADDKVIKFDAKGNETAKKFIEGTDHDRDWKVTVTGTVNGDTMTVDTLSLQ